MYGYIQTLNNSQIKMSLMKNVHFRLQSEHKEILKCYKVMSDPLVKNTKQFFVVFNIDYSARIFTDLIDLDKYYYGSVGPNTKL